MNTSTRSLKLFSILLQPCFLLFQLLLEGVGFIVLLWSCRWSCLQPVESGAITLNLLCTTSCSIQLQRSMTINELQTTESLSVVNVHLISVHVSSTHIVTFIPAEASWPGLIFWLFIARHQLQLLVMLERLRARHHWLAFANITDLNVKLFHRRVFMSLHSWFISWNIPIGLLMGLVHDRMKFVLHFCIRLLSACVLCFQDLYLVLLEWASWAPIRWGSILEFAPGLGRRNLVQQVAFRHRLKLAELRRCNRFEVDILILYFSLVQIVDAQLLSSCDEVICHLYISIIIVAKYSSCMGIIGLMFVSWLKGMLFCLGEIWLLWSDFLGDIDQVACLRQS